jgi:hypothetical protein
MKLWAVILIVSLAFAGCAKQVPVPPKDIHPGLDLKNVRVTTLDGYVYDFDRIVFSADSLTGYSTLIEERTESGEVAYVEVPRETRLSLAVVDQVEREKREVGQVALYGLGVVAVGLIFADVASADDPSGHTGGGGKPPINGPDGR